jgi:hypothetical protein
MDDPTTFSNINPEYQWRIVRAAAESVPDRA